MVPGKKKWFGGIFSRAGDDPTVWLTRAYVLAFLVIGLLTTISHNIMSLLTEQQIESKEISYLIGHETALIRDVSYFVTSYHRDKQSFDKFYFTRAIENLKEAQVTINTYLDSGEYNSKAKETLVRSMREEPLRLNLHIKQFLETADRYAGYSPYVDSPEKEETLKALRKSADEMLPKLLDRVLGEYQTIQIEEMNELYEIERYAAYGIIMVLVLEALLIFRPLAHKVDVYHRTILRQALEDPLTGLRNRRAFMKDVEAYQNTAAREKKSYVAAVCDLDKFKSINDNYGHDVGDVVLKHFANILKRSLRQADIVARFGGEEFVIVLTNIDPDKAALLLDRLRAKIQSTPCFYKGRSKPDSLNYTVSIGFIPVEATLKEDVETSLKMADEALYEAKSTGRNKVVRATRVEKSVVDNDSPKAENVQASPEAV